MSVETLSAVLRGFGRYAFDVEEMDAQCTNDLCERWARHLLYASPRPSGPPTNLPADRRDWFGVRHFVTQQRQTEFAYVTKSMGGMRQAIWTFIEELHRSMSDDHETEQSLGQQLDRLRLASKRATVEEMRQEIAAAVGAISRSM